MRSWLKSLIWLAKQLRHRHVTDVGYRFQRRIGVIRQRQQALQSQSGDDLHRQSLALRQRIADGAKLDAIIDETFALISELSGRTLGLEPFDVQLMAGLAMTSGQLIEMQTGEGKTLAAVFPAILRGCLGRGVHVLTFNDYLAERDARWMGPLYEAFGLSVGFIRQGLELTDRRAAYASDVTYVTAREAGFDFLRDQIVQSPADRVQRGFACAIVDEADSILIDDARVPLVIAGSTTEDLSHLGEYAELVRTLSAGRDYAADERRRNVNLSAAGLQRLERRLGCGRLQSTRNLELLTRLNLALHAETLLQKDCDYLVLNGRIELIDELTGRIAENRRWPYGLQAALEAKEGLVPQPQGRVLTSITLQHFIHQYSRLCGMTGTAREAADEFRGFYNLSVTVIPPHRPSRRFDHPDRIFRTREEKFQAVIDEIRAAYSLRRPVLVGTASVAETEWLAEALMEYGVPCQVLNARADAREASIIADAGALGAVTISTNMAGRGTDILLGGHDQRDRDAVLALGGLYVIGTNRHESRRIDNQLRGRAGRQGDPGETRFLISLEDDLMVRYGLQVPISSASSAALASSGTAVPSPATDPGPEIAHIQRVIEGETYAIRHTLRRYSYCMEQQRRQLQIWRESLLQNTSTSNLLELHAPELYANLTRQFSVEFVQSAERTVTLAVLDQLWSEHLEQMSEVREGIHLVSMGGFDPFDEFNRQATASWRSFEEQVRRQTIAVFQARPLTPEGIDLAESGYVRPSATWTYMINDHPQGDILERLHRGIKQLLNH